MADRGSFHLGRAIDPQTGEAGADEVVVGSSDLTTHGVIVGMTGSGKTGLAIVLIEEALRAGIPAFVLDPKGDMTNLALVFPDLAPASFRPWVSEAEAQAAGVSVDEYAARQATVWREGLAASGIGPERLRSSGTPPT
jgi:DNA helicase HerA-like ATPase